MNILHVGKFLNGKMVGIELMTEQEANQWNVWYMQHNQPI